MTPSKWLPSLCAVLLVTAISTGDSVRSQTPSGPAPLCTVTTAEFNTWKGPGGFVPPNSATFDPSTPCAFYKWSSQMFLWLTTRDTSGGLKMFSPAFDNAVEDEDTSAFQLIRNSAGLGASSKTRAMFRVRVNKPETLVLKSENGVAGDTGSTGQAGGGVLIVNGKSIPAPGKTGLATYPVVYYAIEENEVFSALAAAK